MGMAETQVKRYIFGSQRSWGQRVYESAKALPGDWSFVSSTEMLEEALVKGPAPRYVFLPYWSDIVPAEIVQQHECVCFHIARLPLGRGGSPLQNLIMLGYTEAAVSAFRMTTRLDGGPVYRADALSLQGLAEEIYLRGAGLVADMISWIVAEEPVPVEQKGQVLRFHRRRPEQSEITAECPSLERLFDFLRMLDADGYPRAFLVHEGHRYEFSRPALRDGRIEADVVIRRAD